MIEIPTLAEAAKRQVIFQYAQNKKLVYRLDGTPFTFEVKFSDMDNGKFLYEDKGIYFVKWLRPMLENLADCQYEHAGPPA